MFIVLLDYVKPIEEIDALLEQHRAYLDSLYAAGSTLLASGPRIPRSGGFFIADAASKDALMRVLEEDPFYRAGVAEYHVYECEPTKFTAAFKAALDFRSARLGADPLPTPQSRSRSASQNRDGAD